MKRKLLHKTLQVYLIYSLAILSVSSFVFYLFLKNLYLEEINESLLFKNREFEVKHLPNLSIKDIQLWNKFNESQKIKSNPEKIKQNEFKEIYVFDKLQGEHVPYQELNHPIKIQNKDFILQSRLSLIETEDLIESILLLFCSILVLLLIGLFVLTKLISVKIWKPFYDTLNNIKSFEIDKNKNFEPSSSKIEEFQNLNQAFENLIQTNIQIYHNQREFIENAAHELQTPLAIFQNQLTLLIQNKDLTHEQAEIIYKMNLTLSRLNRLNKNLLFLSKLEKSVFDKNSVSISKSLSDHLELFEEQFASHKLEIKIEIKENVKLIVNQQLLESLFYNLLSNAIKHNYPNGKIEIHLNEKSLKITNTSQNGELLNENLFERFQKTNSPEGNGLGLSILKKIADINQWEISYTFEANLHSFQINF